MRQRVPRRAWYQGGPGRRPRILIEDDSPALAISDFSAFGQAGFDVAYCSGPRHDATACPLLAGGSCPVVAGADVVLHGLDPRLGVATEIRRRHPGTPVLLVQRLRDGGILPSAPPGCKTLPPGCSIAGQVEAARRAVPRRASSPGHRPPR